MTPSRTERALGSPLLDGLSAADAAQVVALMSPAHFPRGDAVMVEGESPHGLYVLTSGEAHVVIRAGSGGERLVTRLGAGSVVGEMSLLTGRPVSATVRAATDLYALRLDLDEFWAAEALHPRLLRNVAAIVAGRLHRTTSRAREPVVAEWTVLEADAPCDPLSRALAASLAWHTRERALLVFAGPGGPPSDGEAAVVEGTGADGGAPGVDVLDLRPGWRGPPDLWRRLEVLPRRYRYILVQAPPGIRLELDEAPLVLRATPEAGGTWRLGADAASGSVTRVPPLGSADMAHLEAGVLPLGTPAGIALGGVARRIARLRVGVALGAGGLKGYAHFGVLRTLAAEGIPVDCIVGSSIGAQIAFCHAVGMSVPDAMDAIDDAASRTVRPSLPAAGVLSSGGLRRGLRQYCGERRIEDLATPLGIVATDLVARSEVVFRRGLAWPALLASMAIPGIYPPLRLGSRLLVDGGVVSPVPTSAAAGMGADVVVGVRLGLPLGAASPRAQSRAPSGRPPMVTTTLFRSIELMQQAVVSEATDAATVMIEPAFEAADPAGVRRFSRGRPYAERGSRAAEAALPRLRALLPWLAAAA